MDAASPDVQNAVVPGAVNVLVAITGVIVISTAADVWEQVPEVTTLLNHVVWDTLPGS